MNIKIMVHDDNVEESYSLSSSKPPDDEDQPLSTSTVTARPDNCEGQKIIIIFLTFVN